MLTILYGFSTFITSQFSIIVPTGDSQPYQRISGVAVEYHL